LADCYFEGVAVAVDAKKAFYDLQSAAALGLADAQYRLGVEYNSGKAITADPSRAFKLFHAAAEQGHLKAQIEVFTAYTKGFGVDADLKDAAIWAQRIAERENGNEEVAKIQAALAEIYLEGRGVPKNLDEAIRWFEKAASYPSIRIADETTAALAKAKQKRAAQRRFIDNGDNTITDRKHGLMWIRSPNLVGERISEYGKLSEFKILRFAKSRGLARRIAPVSSSVKVMLS
jgi:hypothetical protein